MIGEVLYDPTGSEPQREWIELYNAGATNITLDGYKIGDCQAQGGGEGMYQFPTGTGLSPGHLLLVANKASDFISVYGFVPDFELVESDPSVPNLSIYSTWCSGSVNLGNTGDEVLLLDGSNQVIDSLSWGSSSWAFNPTCPDVNEGHSLERHPANQDTNTASDWLDQVLPSPGQVSFSVVFHSYFGISDFRLSNN